MSKRILLMVACCFGLAISAQSNAPLEVISEQEVNQARTLYGELAARRLLALQTLISENSDRPERLQLNLVNEFFSKFFSNLSKSKKKNIEFFQFNLLLLPLIL